MDKPLWFGQLVWSQPVTIERIDKTRIPLGAGIYAFTNDSGALHSHNVLYIGKADGAKQTLRNRVAAYTRRFGRFPGGPPSKHKGMEQLARYYHAHPDKFYVRWTGVVVAREIEGDLIDMFDPRFNNKDEHRRGFDDDQLIPDDMLYM